MVGLGWLPQQDMSVMQMSALKILENICAWLTSQLFAMCHKLNLPF